MSGYRQVELPDLGATLARMAQVDATRQQTALARQTFDQDQAFNAGLAQHAAGLSSGDPTARLAALAGISGLGARGLQFAAPLMREERQSADLRAIMQGGQGVPAAAPAQAMPAATGAPNPQWDDRSLPRGIRNNNPLNLTYVAGQPGVQGSDGRFGRYGSVEDGVAAATRQLQLYAGRGINTLEGIVGRWAPPGENNTGAYVAAVARATGLDPRAQIDMQNPEVLSRIVAAMGQHENGRPIDAGAVQRGVAMGLGGTVPVSSGAAPGGAPAATPAAAPRGSMNLSPQQWAQVEALAAEGSPGAMRMLQIRQMRQRDTTDSYREETRDIGGRQVRGQVNGRTGQFTPYPGQGESAGAGDLSPARAAGVVAELGPRIARGDIQPDSPEYDRYAAAYAVATRPQQVWVDDPSNPGTQRMQLVPGTQFPPERFPAPAAAAYGQPPGAAVVPTQAQQPPAVAPAQAGATIQGADSTAAPSDATAANPTALTRQSPNSTPTGEENLSAGYARRMVEAEGLLGRAIDGGYVPGNLRDATATAIGGARNAGPVSRFIGNSITSTQGQLYRQAQEDWVRAKLRRESGAVIGEDEMAREIQVYFPQPGDSPEVIAQKQQARGVAVQAMRQASGRAASTVPQAAQAGGAPVRVNSPEEAARLAPGTLYVNPQGQRFTR
jgi:hypothetical protein